MCVSITTDARAYMKVWRPTLGDFLNCIFVFCFYLVLFYLVSLVGWVCGWVGGLFCGVCVVLRCVLLCCVGEGCFANPKLIDAAAWLSGNDL